LPDEPVIFWEYYHPDYYDPQYNQELDNIVSFYPGAKGAWIYSKTPIDVTNVEIKINDSYFYYYSYIEEVYNYGTDCSDVAKLELFMEYNGADWEELLSLYNNDKNKYSEEINNWQARYDAVKENVSCYIYQIKMRSIDKDSYNDIFEKGDFSKLEKNYGSKLENLYKSGVLKLYAPESEEVTTITTATLNINGKTLTHKFGEYSIISKDNANVGALIIGEYVAGVSSRVLSNAALCKEKGSVIGELFILVDDEETKERNFFDVALKSVTVLNSDYITIEPIEVKYINTLGVAVSEEWDGSALTFKARNQTAEDSSAYAFAVYFNINLTRTMPSYAYLDAYLNVALSVDGMDGTTIAIYSLPQMENMSAEYYAYMVDNVDITAREEVLGYSAKSMSDAAYNWESHSIWEGEPLESLWDHFVKTGSIA